jgi:hypothetical protein
MGSLHDLTMWGHARDTTALLRAQQRAMAPFRDYWFKIGYEAAHVAAQTGVKKEVPLDATAGAAFLYGAQQYTQDYWTHQRVLQRQRAKEEKAARKIAKREARRNNRTRVL